MYHYTESGLQNVWLVSGFTKRKTPYGTGVSIHDVEGLHRVIGRCLARKSHLTGAELRFLRKEMGMSQSGVASLIGTSEQNVSLWERRGRIPKTSDRLIRLVYLEHIGENPKIRELVERLDAQDQQVGERFEFATLRGQWREAA